MSVNIGLDADATEFSIGTVAFAISGSGGFELRDEPAPLGSSPLDVDVAASAAGANDQVMSRNANGSFSIGFEPLGGVEPVIDQGSA
ncbi:hypothetical protein SAMN03159363_4352 [Variovorax sp. EL159]|nr:hypothetical protein SAMN03159363_4352 [Variovorax sp. EL159]